MVKGKYPEVYGVSIFDCGPCHFAAYSGLGRLIVEADDETRGERLSQFEEAMFIDPNYGPHSSVHLDHQQALTAYVGNYRSQGNEYPITIYLNTIVKGADAHFELIVAILGTTYAREATWKFVRALYVDYMERVAAL